MSKRKNKKVATEKSQATEEQIKSVMELYAPTKIQKFFMKYFSEKTTDNKVRRTVQTILTATAGLGIFFALVGLTESALSMLVITGIIGLPTIGGIIYSNTIDTKRIENISNILGLTKEEVIELEKKYYLV